MCSSDLTPNAAKRCADNVAANTLLNGHVLRSGDRPGLEQETWALLMLYLESLHFSGQIPIMPHLHQERQ